MVTNELSVSLGLETKDWQTGIAEAGTSIANFVTEMETKNIDFKKMFAGIGETLEEVQEDIKERFSNISLPITPIIDTSNIEDLKKTLKETLPKELEEIFKGQEIVLKEVVFDLSDDKAEEISSKMQQKIRPEIEMDISLSSIMRMTDQIEKEVRQPIVDVVEGLDIKMTGVEKAVQAFQDVNIGEDVDKLATQVKALNQAAMKLVNALNT